MFDEAVNLLVKSTTQKKHSSEDVFDFLSRLSHLHLNDKKLGEIPAIHLCGRLTHLYLQNNQLALLNDTLSHCRFITILHLERNKLTSMEGIETLENLSKLYLDGNSISIVKGLERLTQLEELHISNQKLTNGENLTFEIDSLRSIGSSLHTLYVENSKLKSLAPLSVLHNLQYLHAAKNEIDNLEDLNFFLANSPYLLSINLKGNLISKKTKYRDFVIKSSNSLQVLDEKDIEETHRKFLHGLDAQKKKLLSQGGTMMNKQAPQVPTLRSMPFEGVTRENTPLFCHQYPTSPSPFLSSSQASEKEMIMQKGFRKNVR